MRTIVVAAVLAAMAGPVAAQDDLQARFAALIDAQIRAGLEITRLDGEVAVEYGRCLAERLAVVPDAVKDEILAAQDGVLPLLQQMEAKIPGGRTTGCHPDFGLATRAGANPTLEAAFAMALDAVIASELEDLSPDQEIAFRTCLLAATATLPGWQKQLFIEAPPDDRPQVLSDTQFLYNDRALAYGECIDPISS